MSAMSRRSVLAAGGAVVTTFLVGCAPATSGSEVGIGDPDPWGLDPAVLDAWRDFPVTRTPRPILLLGSPLRETGYRTGDAKLAVAMGRHELATTLPSTSPATSTVTLTDGTFPLAIITAAQAYERLRGFGNPANAPGADPVPLLITKVELGTARFWTDRGALDLPAWLFHAPESLKPLAWPAPHPDAFWRLGDFHGGGTGDRRLAADGVTLTVTVPAPDPRACPGDPIYRYHPVVLEGSTVVAVGVRREIMSIAPGSRRDDCFDDLLPGDSKQSPVTLAAPLGKRVLVDSSGEPVPVTVSR